MVDSAADGEFVLSPPFSSICTEYERFFLSPREAVTVIDVRSLGDMFALRIRASKPPPSSFPKSPSRAIEIACRMLDFPAPLIPATHDQLPLSVDTSRL